MWMVMRMVRWENLEVDSSDGIKVNFKSPEYSPGYIPVFNTKEAALDYVNGDESQICELRSVVP
jgi:hypothetical protein